MGVGFNVLFDTKQCVLNLSYVKYFKEKNENDDSPQTAERG